MVQQDKIINTKCVQSSKNVKVQVLIKNKNAYNAIKINNNKFCNILDKKNIIFDIYK
jgi:hypothetical protein